MNTASRDPPAPARLAATILLLRDATAGLEVFMVVRHRRIEFAAGALVFPGGAVESGDRADALRARVPRAHVDLDAGELALRIAAIREAYEECGMLLARRGGGARPVGATTLAGIDARHAGDRAAHRIDAQALAAAEDLEYASDLLVPFAHWITPPMRPKRFDTHFFLAPAPAGQEAVHDGTESVDSVWRAPAAVCAEADAGRWQLMFPTRMNLEKLAKSASVTEALAAAREREVVTVMPEAEKVREGRRLRIPPEAGYGVREVVVDERGVVLSRD